jgi:hypothetical protein
VDEPLARAELARVLGLAEIRRGRPVEAVPTLVGAVREIASTHPDAALDLLLDAMWAASEGGTLEAHATIRELAATVTLAAREASFFIGDLLGGLTAITAGDSDDGASLLESAVERATQIDEPRYVLWAGWASVTLGRAEEAQTLFGRGARLARMRGAIGLSRRRSGLPACSTSLRSGSIPRRPHAARPFSSRATSVPKTTCRCR